MLFFTIRARRWVTNRIYDLGSKNQLNFANFSFNRPSALLFFVQPIRQGFSSHCPFSTLSFITPAVTIPCAKITQLASLGLNFRDIDACALLDSRENFVKKVVFEQCKI